MWASAKGVAERIAYAIISELWGCGRCWSGGRGMQWVHVTVSIAGEPVDVIIDTGSSATIVEQET